MLEGHQAQRAWQKIEAAILMLAGPTICLR